MILLEDPNVLQQEDIRGHFSPRDVAGFLPQLAPVTLFHRGILWQSHSSTFRDKKCWRTLQHQRMLEDIQPQLAPMIPIYHNIITSRSHSTMFGNNLPEDIGGIFPQLPQVTLFCCSIQPCSHSTTLGNRNIQPQTTLEDSLPQLPSMAQYHHIRSFHHIGRQKLVGGHCSPGGCWRTFCPN